MLLTEKYIENNLQDGTELPELCNQEVYDERGYKLAIFKEEGDTIRVERTPYCSLGTYLRIIGLLREMGYEAIT